MPAQKDRLHGTLDALVLKTLSWGPRHGYAITRWIRETSGEQITVEEGSLYPALYRLERQGLLTSEWRTTENGRRARAYALTAAGRRELVAEQEHWDRLSRAVNLVLRMETP